MVKKWNLLRATAAGLALSAAVGCTTPLNYIGSINKRLQYQPLTEREKNIARDYSIYSAPFPIRNVLEKGGIDIITTDAQYEQILRESKENSLPTIIFTYSRFERESFDKARQYVQDPLKGYRKTAIADDAPLVKVMRVLDKFAAYDQNGGIQDTLVVMNGELLKCVSYWNITK